MVDDILVTIKVVEEWGFAIGEDVCLFEDESMHDENDKADDHGVHINSNDVDKLVHEMAEDWVEEERECSSNNNSAHNDHGVEDESSFQDVHVSYDKVAVTHASIQHNCIDPNVLRVGVIIL